MKGSGNHYSGDITQTLIDKCHRLGLESYGRTCSYILLNEHRNKFPHILIFIAIDECIILSIP